LYAKQLLSDKFRKFSQSYCPQVGDSVIVLVKKCTSIWGLPDLIRFWVVIYMIIIYTFALASGLWIFLIEIFYFCCGLNRPVTRLAAR